VTSVIQRQNCFRSYRTVSLHWRRAVKTLQTVKGKGIVDLYSASAWNVSMALRYSTHCQRLTQFYLHTYVSSTSGMSCLCLLSCSWYSFTDPGGMEGWADLDAKSPRPRFEPTPSRLQSRHSTTQPLAHPKTTVALANSLENGWAFPQEHPGGRGSDTLGMNVQGFSFSASKACS